MSNNVEAGKDPLSMLLSNDDDEDDLFATNTASTAETKVEPSSHAGESPRGKKRDRHRGARTDCNQC